jgi:SAM-dependent methyltransferase
MSAAVPFCEICGRPCRPQPISGRSVLWRCPDCGHVIRDLRTCPAGAREEVYGGSVQFDRLRLFFTRRRLLRLLDRLDRRGPLDILEIGYGGGQLLKLFQDRGHRIWGVEVCPSEGPLVEQIRSRGGHLFEEGLDRAELPAATMDLIYLVHVAEHLPDPLAGFQALSRCARQGALLYLITPNGGSAGLKLFGDRWWHLEDPTHRRFFTPPSIRAGLAQAGFQVLSLRAPLADSLSLEINSLLRFVWRRGAVMDRPLTPWLDLLLMPVALAGRLLWPRLRPNIEVVARKAGQSSGGEVGSTDCAESDLENRGRPDSAGRPGEAP